MEAAVIEFPPKWSLAPTVEALQALRGINLVAAATIVAEIGDLRRFISPRQFRGYPGLVASERSTGDTVRRLGITKAGNGRVGEFSSRVRGFIATYPNLERPSAISTSDCRLPYATLRSKRSHGSAAVTGRCLLREKSGCETRCLT
jgi:hypothetical protein